MNQTELDLLVDQIKIGRIAKQELERELNRQILEEKILGLIPWDVSVYGNCFRIFFIEYSYLPEKLQTFCDLLSSLGGSDWGEIFPIHGVKVRGGDAGCDAAAVKILSISFTSTSQGLQVIDRLGLNFRNIDAENANEEILVKINKKLVIEQ